MRILIADDEALVRYGLKSVLNDVLDEMPTFIEAANGRDLVRKVSESRPHIAFVDIRMPQMTGLEAISQGREIAPNVLWVVLTGHADFSYAREALKLGVEDYLVKPADPVEVKDLMARLLLKVKQQQITANRELEAKISAVLGETTSPQYDTYFQKFRFWQAALIMWDSLLPEQEESLRRRDFAFRVRTLLDDGDDFSGTIVSMRNGNLLMVFSVPAGGMPMVQIIGLWNRRFRSIRSNTSDIPGESVGDTWLLTQVVQDPEELFREIDLLETGACLRFLHNPGTLIDFSDLTRKPEVKRLAPVAELLDEIGRTWRFGREEEFHGLVHILEDRADRLSSEKFISGGPAWYARYIVPLSGKGLSDLKDLIHRLLEEGHSLFEKRQPPSQSDAASGSLVERAGAIMERRYRETIGIAQVAEELGVSPNYLSTVFKKETGTSFTRHMTDLRLKKACELLKRPEANVGDVALSLGYQSSRHFTRLFKDRYERTPSEWILDQRI